LYGLLGLLMIVLLVSSLVAYCSDFPFNGNPIKWVQAKEVYSKGIHEREQFHLRDALKYFQQATNIYPNDARFQFANGETYQRIGDYTKARECLEKATTLAPGNLQAWLHLGEVFSVLKMPEEAQKATHKAISLEPLNAEAQCQLALLLLASGKPEEAQKTYEGTRNLERDTGRYWYLSGRIYHLNHQPQETEAAFHQAADLDRTEPEYAEWLGISLLATGKIDESLPWLKKATQINQENAVYWDNLASASAAQQDWQTAEQCLEKACKLEPSDLTYRMRYSMLLIKENKKQAAEATLATLFQSNRNNREVCQLYTHCLLRQKKYAQAETVLNDYIASGDGSRTASAWTFLGDVLRQDKQAGPSADAYRKALALGPNAKLKEYLERRLSERDVASVSGNNTITSGESLESP
jgi:tetratricopeptide (TPR) repeat protein